MVDRQTCNGIYKAYMTYKATYYHTGQTGTLKVAERMRKYIKLRHNPFIGCESYMHIWCSIPVVLLPTTNSIRVPCMRPHVYQQGPRSAVK